MRKYLLVLGLSIFATGCDARERLSKLEKQNQDLQAEIKKRDNAPADLEAQARCAKDSKAWFNENYSADKDTVLLTYTNHYAKGMNLCFIYVEYHFSIEPKPSWINDVSLWNVYENNKYGSFAVRHGVYYIKGDVKTEDTMISCSFLGKECKTLDEFNNMARPYIND